jgi:hypothetical protein
MSRVLEFRLMMHAQALAFDSRHARQLLKQTTRVIPSGVRIEALSRHLLGRPYIANSLKGSAVEREIFTARLDAFDCVTYIETVLAMSRSSGTDDFLKWLRLLRYDQGRVEWKKRNHYMVSWIRNNVRLGVIKRVPLPAKSVTKSRILNVVPGLPAVSARFRCVPKRFLASTGRRLRTGDIVFFASTRLHLDVFHCGIIVRQHDRLLLRHASRSRQRVVEQELSEFANDNRMAGVIIVRPT